MIHGLNDTALMAGGLNNTWNWLEQDLTLVTVLARATSCNATRRTS
jgi:hypothetical protein